VALDVAAREEFVFALVRPRDDAGAARELALLRWRGDRYEPVARHALDDTYVDLVDGAGYGGEQNIPTSDGYSP